MNAVALRTTFATSRLLEFCSRKELTAQTGHETDDWPLVILKELIDNAADACEEAGIAPVIRVTVARGKIRVRDNGPGIPPETITSILDFTTRTSSREAYVAPDRGRLPRVVARFLDRKRHRKASWTRPMNVAGSKAAKRALEKIPEDNPNGEDAP